MAPPTPPTTTTTTAYYGKLAESVNGTLRYTLSDTVLGSVSASLNTSGAVTATQLYSPYGGVRFQSGTLPTDYGFTHQRSDASYAPARSSGVRRTRRAMTTRSGKSLKTPSTSHAISWRIVAQRFAVQTLTRSPASCAAQTVSCVRMRGCG